jgi:hypothetical protein
VSGAAAAPPSRRREREGDEEADAEDEVGRFEGVDCDCLEVGQDKSTDNTDPGAWSWCTTPGARIAMIGTPRGTTGGVIISWVVTSGANGFGVNPVQFTYVDRSFTNPGKVQAPDPGGTGSQRAPSASSASTTAICPPIRTPVSAQEAGFTHRAPP